MKDRKLAGELNQLVGERANLAGWVHARRDHGKIIFFDLRDRTGLTQVVVTPETPEAYAAAQNLHPEDVVELTGQVQARPEKLKNPGVVSGDVEVLAENISVVEAAAQLPFPINDPNLEVSLPVLLDHRPLSLRHTKIRDIFTIKAAVINGFRQSLTERGFTEIFPPTLAPTATEGGSEVFKVDYYDHKAFLTQSPQLYKQMMVGVFERVFAVVHAYRAEPSATTRHLAEYVSLDAEMGFIESYEEIMATVEATLKQIFSNLAEKHGAILDKFSATVPEMADPLPRLKLKEAQEIIYKETGRDNLKEPDLSPQDERDICAWAKREKGSELIFITHYPTKKRPMYTYPDPENPEETLSFDLLGRGVEWVTGGQRINNYEQLVGNIKKWGNDPALFEMYLQAFKYGMPKEGGFAIGAERLVMNLLDLENIREASIFPRDMERVDIRLSKPDDVKK